jgi:DNA repair protein RadD
VKVLRPYQSAAIDNIRASLRNGVRRLVVQGPCGFGKTLVAATIANGATAKGKRMAFVCPAISLVDQTVEAFWAEGCRDVGVIQQRHAMTNPDAPIQVCSIQTIASRGEFPRADVVVFDEVHTMHEAHRKWMADPEWAAVPFIGLSATPWTKGLGKHFQSLIIAATTQELIDQGFLSKFKVFACPRADLSNVSIVAGDYHQEQLSTAMRGGTLTADVVKNWRERWRGERWRRGKTLVFGVDREHAETLHLRFLDAGVKSAYQDANTPLPERASIKRGFHNGTFEVVCNVGTLTTGVDWDVRCLVLARPTKSEMLYVQIIGRALRTAEGKDYAVIFDHSDTTETLGFVTDIQHDNLHDGRKAEKAEPSERRKPLPRPCPSCASLAPRLARVCPDCGFRLPLASGVVERDGVLVEFVPGQLPPRSAGQRQYSVAEKREWCAMFKGYALEHGKSMKWVLAQYHEKFGEWPKPRGVVDTMNAIDPSYEVFSWVKSRAKAWARDRHREARLAARQAAE